MWVNLGKSYVTALNSHQVVNLAFGVNRHVVGSKQCSTIASIGVTIAPQTLEKMSARCILGGEMLAPRRHSTEKKSPKSYLRADGVITSVNNRGN
jgi:hypothetical protein